VWAQLSRARASRAEALAEGRADDGRADDGRADDGRLGAVHADGWAPAPVGALLDAVEDPRDGRWASSSTRLWRAPPKAKRTGDPSGSTLPSVASVARDNVDAGWPASLLAAAPSEAVSAFFAIEPVDAASPPLSAWLWVGEPGSVAAPRLRRYHSFHSVSSGARRFTLFAPTLWTHLSLFPFSHPRAGEAQIDLQSIDLDRFPELAGLVGGAQSSGAPVARTATVKAGQTLFVPAFWFALAEDVGETPTVAVEVREASAEALRVERWASQPLPLEDEWPAGGRKRRRAAAAFVKGVLDAVYGPGRGLELVRAAVRTMHDPLRPSQTVAGSRATGAAGDRAAESSTAPRAELGACASAGAVVDDFAARARRLGERFRAVQNGAREVVLVELVERICVWAAGEEGSAQLLRDMVEQCA
jgi:hypothetical protein